MSSEFGMIRQSSSDGQRSIKPASRRTLIHRRARSLLTTLLPSSTGSIQKSQLSSSRSDSFASGESTIHQIDNKGNDKVRPDVHRSMSYRRLRWTMETDWRQLETGLADDPPDLFLGVAVTSPSGSPRESTYTGRKRTEQRLRNYHRPTQINVEQFKWPSSPIKAQSIHPESNKRCSNGSNSSSASSSRTAPFQGRANSWSPALLTKTETFKDGSSSPHGLCFSMSSSISFDSHISRKNSFDDKKQVWRVSSSDQFDL